jgi:hypothetical protein
MIFTRAEYGVVWENSSTVNGLLFSVQKYNQPMIFKAGEYQLLKDYILKSFEIGDYHFIFAFNQYIQKYRPLAKKPYSTTNSSRISIASELRNVLMVNVMLIENSS